MPHTTLTRILGHLRNYFPQLQLPKHAKTLLRTPRTSNVRGMEYGHYVHFGIEQGVRDYHTMNISFTWDVQIDVGIDEMSTTDSGHKKLWPILSRVFSDGEIFIIGCYIGISHLKSCFI